MSADHGLAEPIEHVGWDLWRASAVWKRRFNAAMTALGFASFGEARGQLLQYIGRDGIAQSALAKRSGMSKQAVQQHLDELVNDGLVERVTDPADARRKQVQFTNDGAHALQAADKVKRAIENDYRQLLGGPALEDLKKALALIIDVDQRRES